MKKLGSWEDQYIEKRKRLIEEDDRDRPDWRELDRKKDRSLHVRSEDKVTKESLRRSKAALKSLFGSGPAKKKLPENSAQSKRFLAMMKKYRTAESEEDAQSMVEAIYKDFGVTEDFELIGAALYHPENEIVLAALDRIEKLDAGAIAGVPKSILMQIETIELAGRDSSIMQAAARARAKFQT